MLLQNRKKKPSYFVSLQFSFGDIDGKGCEAKLQHPMAVAVAQWSNPNNEDETVVLVNANFKT